MKMDAMKTDATIDSNLKKAEVLVIGTCCADMQNPRFNFLEDIAGDGLVVDSCRMVDVKQNWLRKTDDSFANGGGALNIAPLISLSGINAGIVTALGTFEGRYDPHGQFMKRLMKENDVEYVIIRDEMHPSSASFVRPKNESEGIREAILHCPNAVDHMDVSTDEFARMLRKVDGLEIIHYIYSGLAKKMDEGERLAHAVRKWRDEGYLVMVDTHTHTGDPDKMMRSGKFIRKYNLLEPILPHASFFFANYKEAEMITNTLGQKLKSDDQASRNNEFLLMLKDRYWTQGDPKIFGVTAGTKVHLMYMSQNTQVGPIIVPSRFVMEGADNLIGAGDAFRAGFEAEFIGNGYKQEFEDGSMCKGQLERLAQFGHMMAAIYVTRQPGKQYDEIPKREKMGYVIVGGKKLYSRKKDLLKDLGMR